MAGFAGFVHITGMNHITTFQDRTSQEENPKIGKNTGNINGNNMGEEKKTFEGWTKEQIDAFQRYYKLGAGRTLRKLSEDKKVGRSIITLKRWSSSLGWADLVLKMDAQAGEKTQEKIIEKAAEKDAEEILTRENKLNESLNLIVDFMHESTPKIIQNLKIDFQQKETFDVKELNNHLDILAKAEKIDASLSSRTVHDGKIEISWNIEQGLLNGDYDEKKIENED